MAASEPPNRTDRPATAVGAVLWDREVASPSRWTSREWARPASSSAFQRSRTPAVCIPALFPAPGPAAVPCALGAALAADTRHQHPAAGPAASRGPLPCPSDRAGRAGLAGQGWARQAGSAPGPDGCSAPRVLGSRPEAAARAAPRVSCHLPRRESSCHTSCSRRFVSVPRGQLQTWLFHFFPLSAKGPRSVHFLLTGGLTAPLRCFYRCSASLSCGLRASSARPPDCGRSGTDRPRAGPGSGLGGSLPGRRRTDAGYRRALECAASLCLNI